MKKKYTVTIFAAALLSVSVCAAAGFMDVDDNAWYANEVKDACELGLMQGLGEGQFLPDGEVSIAEAVTVAARTAAALSEETITAGEGQWYAPFMEYGKAHGFVTEDMFASPERTADRADVAYIFAHALPKDAYTLRNDVSDVHDVPKTWKYRGEILTMYKAGIMMGSDDYGTFYPASAITRAELAAVINRLHVPEKRLQKNIKRISEDDAFTLCSNSGMNSQMSGINSGWLLDNRGGLPRTTVSADYSSITDISKTAGTALIREFNKTSTGNIRLYTNLSVVNPNGFYIEYRNEAGDAVYRAEVRDRTWCVMTADGEYTPVYPIPDGESKFTIILYTDLDNAESRLYINDKETGVYPLLKTGDEANVYNFRYATTNESMSSYKAQETVITSNYLLNEGFGNYNTGAQPRFWDAEEGVGIVGSLTKEYLEIPFGKSASYSFNAIGGKPIVDFNFLLPENESMEYTVYSNGIPAAVFTTDENGFCLNGEKVYDGQYKNLWYRCRLEFDTEKQTVFIRVNGRDRGTYALLNTVTSVNRISMKNNSETPIGFDNCKVFKYIDHDDYVPEPIIPAGADDYLVGMNVCSLWSNGGHYGWACITPFDDPSPVLGYYDENLPETADWEIKYLTEHGVDIQAFCIFFYGSEPFNLSGTHLMEGFMNAKYSDKAKFCMLLESANGDNPTSFEDWKDRWVPYIIENFIKHESYAVQDNRPIIDVFSPSTFSDRVGGDAEMKKCFDYLEDEVVKLGFDGMIYLSSSGSSARLPAMGFDGCAAYNWAQTGFDPAVNKQRNTDSGDANYVYNVPCATVGFNSMPWSGLRYPMMTMDDYAEVHRWIRDEYLPAFADYKWQENFVWLSTWNEYGEGTYIMPATDEKGFGYLDVIRDIYTKEGIDASINTIPTEAQRYRINHRYPQYRRLLRAEGYYEAKPDEKASETLLTVNIADLPAGDIWSMKNISAGENGVTATSSISDPIFMATRLLKPIDTSEVTHIKFTARIPKSEYYQIFYGTGNDTSASESRSISGISVTDEMTTLYFPTDKLNGWGGALKFLRIDPVNKAGVDFTVKSVEFIRENGAIKKQATVNGLDYSFSYPLVTESNGDVLFAFDPQTGIDFRLGCFHEWRKDMGELKLHFEDHDMVYTVGKDSYILDGEEVKLPYTIGTLDGLPMIPLNRLCRDAGFEYKMDADRKITVNTAIKSYYDAIEAEKVPGKWEFNNPGDNESWSSSLMTILTNEGYMSCDSRSDVWTLTDYTITSNSSFVPFSADDKVCMEVRVRFNFVAPDDKEQTIKMYFTTMESTNYNEQKTVFAPHVTNDTNGEWVTYRIPVPESFKGTIKSLRFDPFDAFGHMDIDYIRFLTAEEAKATEAEASEK